MKFEQNQKAVKIIAWGFAFLAALFFGVLVRGRGPGRHFSVYPVMDASTEKQGSAAFALPHGHYSVVISREPGAEDDQLELYYLVEVPDAGIRLMKDSVVPLRGIDRAILDTFTLKKNNAKGTMIVKILSPSKGKVTIGLTTEDQAGT